MGGRVTKALAGFEDEGAHWDWDWNMKNVATSVRARLHHLAPERRKVADHFVESYSKALTPEVMGALPHSVLHSDLNDTNLLFKDEEAIGILDFGDFIYGCTIFGLGIAAGYYALGQTDPVFVFCEVLRGYLAETPLSDPELEAFYHVAYGRMLLSACFS